MIADMFINNATEEGYAFKYAPGIAITSRSPYIQRVTVLNKGSNITAGDPYGYDSADFALLPIKQVVVLSSMVLR